MANRYKGEVEVELDGIKILKYNTNALVAIEEAMDVHVDEIGMVLAAGVGIKDIRKLLWAGLLHADKKLTLDEVGDMMDIADAEIYGEAVSKALGAAFGIDPNEPTESLPPTE